MKRKSYPLKDRLSSLVHCRACDLDVEVYLSVWQAEIMNDPDFDPSVHTYNFYLSAGYNNRIILNLSFQGTCLKCNKMKTKIIWNWKDKEFDLRVKSAMIKGDQHD